MGSSWRTSWVSADRGPGRVLGRVVGIGSPRRLTSVWILVWMWSSGYRHGGRRSGVLAERGASPHHARPAGPPAAARGAGEATGSPTVDPPAEARPRAGSRTALGGGAAHRPPELSNKRSNLGPSLHRGTDKMRGRARFSNISSSRLS